MSSWPRRCGVSTIDVTLVTADAATIDALARAQLAAGRVGRQVQLRGASQELRELLSLCGLEAALPVEMGREAEQREQRLGVEEERELDDPPV
jgi:ABC-type transporter Mla MlaB component